MLRWLWCSCRMFVLNKWVRAALSTWHSTFLLADMICYENRQGMVGPRARLTQYMWNGSSLEHWYWYCC